MIAEMLAEDESRSSLLGDAGGAGHDGRFFLASEDGSFRLNVQGLMQTRYTINYRENGVDDDFAPGFSVHRTRLKLTGHVLDEDLAFEVESGWTPARDELTLLDAFIKYRLGDHVRVRAGRGILKFWREFHMPVDKLLTAERSLTSFVFTQNRSEFAELRYRDDGLTVHGAFSNGFRSFNRSFDDHAADFAFTLRGDAKLDGTWEQLEDGYFSPPGSEFAMAFGVGVHYEQSPNVPTSNLEEQKLLAWTADVIAKGDRWHLFGAAVGHHIFDQGGVAGEDFVDLGFLVQGSYALSDKLELLARYDVIVPDNDRPANDVFSTALVGMNYYFAGYAARFSAALLYFPDPTSGTQAGYFAGAGARSPVSGNFGTLASEDEQFSALLQFQLLF